MPSASPDRPLSLDAPELVAGVRAVLGRAGYDEGRIREALDVSEVPPFRIRRRMLPLFLRRLRADTPLHTLLRLFVLNQPVTRAEADRALEPQRTDDWVSIGLLKVEQDVITAAVALDLFQHLVLAVDWPETPEA